MKTLLSHIMNAGVEEGLNIRYRQRIRLTNKMALVAMGAYLLLIIFGIWGGAKAIIFVNVFLLLMSILGIWLNKLGKYLLAKILLLSVNSIIILLLSKLMNTPGSVVELYFPILAAYLIFYDFKEERKGLIISFVITIVCIILSLALPPYIFGSIVVPATSLVWFDLLNHLLSFGIFFFFLYVAVQINAATEKKLVEGWEEARQNAAALEEARAKAERALQSKSRFLSNMSHELRTPLNGIIGSANLLLQEQYLPEQRSNFEVLKFSSEHMLSLINDILDFNKLEAGKMVPDKKAFNVFQTVQRFNTLFGQQFAAKGVELEITCDALLDKEYIGDETRLNQVLNNLVSNALKFTDTGKVKLSACKIHRSNDIATVLFSVEDTGIGIPQEQQAYIFDSFTQGDTSHHRNYGGTGLGLAISKRIVEMFGGRLELESEAGQGSCFYFTASLPVNTVGQIFMNENSVRGLQSLGGLKVLVAEDNAVNMLVTRKFLHRWDVEIVEAINGQEALAVFKQQDFDLLLVDLEMPEMDGYELMREIRKTNLHIPAIAFTAAVFENMHQQLTSYGFSDYIQKPFRPEELHDKLNEVIRRKVHDQSAFPLL
jgi:signal transduction histidine kinase/CheY-like chemotaxis protein